MCGEGNGDELPAIEWTGPLGLATGPADEPDVPGTAGTLLTCGVPWLIGAFTLSTGRTGVVGPGRIMLVGPALFCRLPHLLQKIASSGRLFPQ